MDADGMDAVTDANLESTILFAGRFAEDTGAIVAITGAIDIVTDGDFSYVIRNGHPLMSKVTGTGCMLSAMMTAYLTANQEQPLEAAAAAVCAMGLAGERAYQRLSAKEGNASYRSKIIDEIFLMDGKILEGGARLRKYRLQKQENGASEKIICTEVPYEM